MSVVKFVFVCSGIFLMFFLYNILTETLYSTAYGDEKFTFGLSLLFCTTSVNVLGSFSVLKFFSISDEYKLPYSYQFGIAVPYLLSPYLSLVALKWVSYPALVIAKSSKPVPVLVLGALIGRKRYHISRYVMVVLIVIGLVLFMYKQDQTDKSNVGFGYGELLLILSLFLDGVVTSLEERIMSNQPVNPVRLMFDLNVVSILFIGVALVFVELFAFASFAKNHPSVLWIMLSVGLCSAVGQFFIFKCVTDFGTLTCSIVTTVRKFFTLLGSVLLFSHAVHWRQWTGVALVFGGLLLDIYFGKFRTRPNAAPAPDPASIDPPIEDQQQQEEDALGQPSR